MLFYEVYFFSLLFYKQLLNKVKLLSLILNVYFIGFQLLVKEIYTQALH